jgi:hypothetical protein
VVVTRVDGMNVPGLSTPVTAGSGSGSAREGAACFGAGRGGVSRSVTIERVAFADLDPVAFARGFPAAGSGLSSLAGAAARDVFASTAFVVESIVTSPMTLVSATAIGTGGTGTETSGGRVASRVDGAGTPGPATP